MKKAFTLLELIVVVGIMGFLGVAAISGYNALQRGMSERSVGAIASSILRAAQERAHVDRLPTVVFCYNRLLKEPTGPDDNGVVVGMMTAIRRSGRITLVKGSCLFDEFADLDTTYEPVDEESQARKSGTRRLFKFNGGSTSSMDYSIVSDRVLCDEESEMVTLFSGTSSGPQTNLLSSAFFDVGGGTIGASGWKVGDGYAFEFAETQLPDGYVFGTQIPNRAGDIKFVKAIDFRPDQVRKDTIEIYFARPDGSGMPRVGSRPVVTASADSEKGV